MTAQSAEVLPREAGFDVLRIVAASLVIVSHGFALVGRPEPRVLGGDSPTLGSLGVNAFFAISGYLVLRSWARDPDVVRFALRRAGRLLPGLLVALLLTALVIGPLVSALGPEAYFGDPAWVRYVVVNATFLPVQYDLPGVFADRPFDAVNGTLWTLRLEVLAYVLLAVLGVASLLHRRAVLSGALVLCLAVATVADERYVLTLPLQDTARLVGCFATGALLSALPRTHPAFRAPALLVSAAALVLGCAADLVVLQYVGLSHLVVAAGRAALLPRLHRAGDPSYGMYIYGWPIAQLVIPAFPAGSPLAVMIVGELALAAAAGYASWFAVEQPVLRVVRSRVRAAARSRRGAPKQEPAS